MDLMTGTSFDSTKTPLQDLLARAVEVPARGGESCRHRARQIMYDIVLSAGDRRLAIERLGGNMAL